MFGFKDSNRGDGSSVCNSLKVVNDIKNKKSKTIEYKDYLRLLELYIPGITQNVFTTVNNANSKGLYGKELSDFIDMTIDSYITSFFMTSAPICKQYKESLVSGGKKKVIKKKNVTSIKKTLKKKIVKKY